MTTEDIIQRTFWISPKLWAKFQKQSIDLNKSSSERIVKFIEEEINYNKGGKK